MAAPDLTLIADIDFRKGSQKLNRQLRSIEKRGININTRRSEQALGRITGKASEFSKSLEASNARVIAFGASVAVIEGVRRAFASLVSTVTEVEDKLTAINSIFGRTDANIQKFGKSLFQIAKQTGQAFGSVADTAQEFARQGLSVEETLKRTNDALILQRLTTLNTEKSVASLTAAINAFEKQALTSTQVINKLRAVETSFAVSSGDLSEALARSASVAQDANVSFDELLGVITAIKQRTGLGGATIGQGLKTVFTRLNLPTRIEQLRALGVEIDESAGGLEKLRQVSIAVGKAQKEGNTTLATQIGAVAAGQFQISKLSAAFSDLASQYSVTDAAAAKSAQATNEAILANEKYNETIKSVSNAIQQNFKSIFDSIGQLGAEGAIKDVLVNFNAILEAFQGNKVDAGPFVEIVTAVIRGAKDMGILSEAAKGFVNALTGPGFVAAAAVVINLLKKTLIQGGGAILQLTGINNATQRRAELQKGINVLLNQATEAEQRQFAAAKNVAAQQQVILQILQRQVAAQNALAGGLGTAGFSRLGGLNVRRYGRNFASGNTDPIQREQNAINRGVGGATKNAEVRIVPRFNYGNGKVGPAVINSDEVMIPSKKGDVVLTRDMIRGAKGFAAGQLRGATDIQIASAIEMGLPLNKTQKKLLEKYAGTNPSGAAGNQKISRRLASVISRAGGIQEVLLRKNPSNPPMFPPLPRGTGRRFDQFNVEQRLRLGANPLREKEFVPNISSVGRENISGPPFRRKESTFERGFGVLTSQEASRRLSPVDINETFDFKRTTEKAFGVKLQTEKEKRQLQREVERRANIKARALRSELKFQAESSAFFEGQSVPARTKIEIMRRTVDAEIEKLRKSGKVDDKILESPEGKKIVSDIKNKVKAQIRLQGESVNKLIQDKKLEEARAIFAKESKSSVRSLGFERVGRGERAAFGVSGLNAASKAQLRQEIQAARIARGQKIATRGGFAALGLSFAAPAIGSIAGNFASEGNRERVSGGVTNVLSGAATGATLGAFAGPYGLAIGAVAGGAIGLVSTLQDTGKETDELAKKIQKLRENISDTNNNVNQYIQFQSQLNALIAEGRGATPEANLLRFRAEEARKGFGASAQSIIAKGGSISEIQQAAAQDTLNKEKEAKNLEAQAKIIELQKKTRLQTILLGRSFDKKVTTNIQNPFSFVPETITKTVKTNILRRQGIETQDVKQFSDLAAALINLPELVDKFGTFEELKTQFSSTVSSFDRNTQSVEALKAVFEQFNLDANALPADISNATALSLIRVFNNFINQQLTKEYFVRGAPLVGKESGKLTQEGIEDFNRFGGQPFTGQSKSDIPFGLTLDDQGKLVPKKSTIPSGYYYDPADRKIKPIGQEGKTFDRDTGKFVSTGGFFDRDAGVSALPKKPVTPIPASTVLDSFQLSGAAQSAIQPRLQNDDFFFKTFLPSVQSPVIDPSVTARGIDRLNLDQSVFGPAVGSDIKTKDGGMVDTKTVEVLDKLNATLESFKEGDLGKIVQELAATYTFILDVSSGGQIIEKDPEKLEEQILKIFRGEIAKYDKNLKAELKGKPLPSMAT